MRDISRIQHKKGFISDMDGVIYHTNILLPGTKEFVRWLEKRRSNFYS